MLCLLFLTVEFIQLCSDYGHWKMNNLWYSNGKCLVELQHTIIIVSLFFLLLFFKKSIKSNILPYLWAETYIQFYIASITDDTLHLMHFNSFLNSNEWQTRVLLGPLLVHTHCCQDP